MQLIEKQNLFSQVAADDDYALLDRKAHIICAPQDDKSHTIIFWTKDNPNDNSPTVEEIMSCVNFMSTVTDLLSSLVGSYITSSLSLRK